MAERGTSSAAAAEVAAYRTRDAKDYDVDPDTQRAGVALTRAAEFDLTPESIDHVAARPTAASPSLIGARDLDAALADLEATTPTSTAAICCCAGQSAARGRRRAGARGRGQSLLVGDG